MVNKPNILDLSIFKVLNKNEQDDLTEIEIIFSSDSDLDSEESESTFYVDSDSDTFFSSSNSDTSSEDSYSEISLDEQDSDTKMNTVSFSDITSDSTDVLFYESDSEESDSE